MVEPDDGPHVHQIRFQIESCGTSHEVALSDEINFIQKVESARPSIKLLEGQLSSHIDLHRGENSKEIDVGDTAFIPVIFWEEVVSETEFKAFSYLHCLVHHHAIFPSFLSRSSRHGHFRCRGSNNCNLQSTPSPEPPIYTPFSCIGKFQFPTHQGRARIILPPPLLGMHGCIHWIGEELRRSSRRRPNHGSRRPRGVHLYHMLLSWIRSSHGFGLRPWISRAAICKV